MSSPGHGSGEWGCGQRSLQFDGAKEQQREQELDSNPLYGLEDHRSSRFFENDLQDAGTSSHYPNSSTARFEAIAEELSPPVGVPRRGRRTAANQGSTSREEGSQHPSQRRGHVVPLSFRALCGSCASYHEHSGD
jgi:hypothetical protein